MLSPNEGHNETGSTMQSAGPIVNHGNPLPSDSSSKAANLDTGKSKADKMHLRSDIQALAKLKFSAS